MVALVVVWKLGAQLLAGSFVLAPPTEVLVSLVQNAGLLSRAFLVTGRDALPASVLGNLAAVALACLNHGDANPVLHAVERLKELALGKYS